MKYLALDFGGLLQVVEVPRVNAVLTGISVPDEEQCHFEKLANERRIVDAMERDDSP